MFGTAKVFDNAINRYHLIRNLYSEIERNHGLYLTVNSLFPKWKKENIDGTKEPALMERLTWNKTLSTRVYDCSQTKILKSLWGKEIPNIHELYSNYIELDRLLVCLLIKFRTLKIQISCLPLIALGNVFLESCKRIIHRLL